MQQKYTDLELRRVQEIAASILESVVKLCNDNNIKCFIAFGTALGAVRHKGFIPWDDDIDIGMLRDDYNKFIKIAPDQLKSKGLVVQSFETEPNCPDAFLKVRKHGTTFTEYYNRNLSIEKGIFIDVFPFDKVPDDERLRARQHKKVQRLLKLYAYRQTPELAVKSDGLKGRIKAIARYAVYGVMHIITPKRLHDAINKTMCLYNGTNSKIYGSLFYPKPEVGYIDEENIINLDTVEFEGFEVCAPGNVCDYLKRQYGDYMKLPPESERYGHRPYEIKFCEEADS